MVIHLIPADLVRRIMYEWNGQAAEAVVIEYFAVDLALVGNLKYPAWEIRIFAVVLVGGRRVFSQSVAQGLEIVVKARCPGQKTICRADVHVAVTAGGDQ